MKTALLLSGGMDSIAIAYWQKPDLAITVDYGQKAAAGEIRAASAVCRALNIEHHVIHSDLSALGSGDMAGTPALKVAPASEWWPFRNQLLITIAAMKCISVGATQILLGCLKTDGFHIDSTSDFISKISQLVALQEGAITISAPAMSLDAAELIIESCVPPEILSWAHSCHASDYACGMCRGCEKHYRTMKALGHAPY